MAWIGTRLLSGLLTIGLSLTAVFFALRLLPGDAISAQLIASGASPAAIAERRAQMGLDQGAWTQYSGYIVGVLRGDFGVSLLTGQPVAEIIFNQLDSTIALGVSALAVAVSSGIPLGVVAGTGMSARLAQSIIGLMTSLPVFWTGTIALYLFAGRLRLLPAFDDGSMAALILPALTLGVNTAGNIARVTWGAVAGVLPSGFVRAARGKGLHETAVMWRHVLRPALPAVFTAVGLHMGFLFSGVVITETLFSRPGLGRLLLTGALEQDYPLVQGVAIWIAVVVVMAGWIGDAAAWLLDVRLRESSL